MTKIRTLDLFSGIGGFSLGLERTGGFETVAFVECAAYPKAVLRQHWPHVPIYEDVKTLTSERLRADGIFVDAICGGFPCQDLSLAGKGAGLKGERSGLWFEFHRLIKEINPQWVIIENVSALRSRGLDQILGSLFKVGYDAEWHCISASAVGAPHQRDRIWIVAHPCSSGRQQISRSSYGYEKENAWRPAKNDYFVKCNGESNFSREVSGTLAESIIKGLERHSRDGEDGRQKKQNGSASSEGLCGRGDTKGWWSFEPDVGRVANGVPKRVDRLKALGNSLVPQIPEIIGGAILEVSKRGLK